MSFLIRKIERNKLFIKDIAISENLLITSGTYDLTIFSISTGEILNQLEGVEGLIEEFEVLPNSNYLVTAEEGEFDCWLGIRNILTGKLISMEEEKDATYVSLSISQKNNKIYAAIDRRHWKGNYCIGILEGLGFGVFSYLHKVL